jgi:hypothetical protein
MMKLMIGSALLGLVAANVDEITTGANGIEVVRRDVETSVVDIDVRLERAVGQAQVQAERAAYNATLTATMAVTNSLTDMQANVNAQMADMAAASSASVVAMEAQMNTLSSTLTETLNTRLDDMSTAVAGVRTELSTSVEQALSRSAVSSTNSLSTMNASLLTAIGNKASAFQHVWLGGCANANHGCWQDFCLNRVELDKAAPYFRKSSNTRMKALIAGMFRMQAYFMGTRNWMHVSVYINGQRRRNTHAHTYHGWWKSDYSDHTFYIAANQDFWFQGCGHFHSASSTYQHQRQEFMYVGKRAP